MNKPILSEHFKKRMPSDVRLGQIKFGERKVKPALVNVAIGNVSLPTNPAMQKRMFSLDAPESPFAKGIVRYSGTAGVAEAQDAFKNILKCEGFDTSKLFVQVTDGGSSGMELLLLGVCGAAGTDDRPLMMIDPAYTNYISFAERIGRKTVTVQRHLGSDGKFSLPELDKIEETIKKHNPGALLVIPYDNPTGQLYDYTTLKELAKICVK
jgi:aspartate aminotransferase